MCLGGRNRVSDDKSVRLTRAAVLGVTTIVLVFTATLIVASAVILALHQTIGIPYSFEGPNYIRALGLVSIGVGLWFIAWTFLCRRPTDIIISTWITIRKLLKRAQIDEPAGRKEPFLPLGPYRFVRNPIYFGAVSALFGGGIYLGSTTFLVWSLLMLLWFWFVLIPFEERELSALFGAAYERYKKEVPKMLPTGRRYKGPEESLSLSR